MKISQHNFPITVHIFVITKTFKIQNYFSKEKAAEILDQINQQIIEKEKDLVENMKKLNAKYVKESQDIQIKLGQGFEKVSILLIHILQPLQFCKSVSFKL